MKKLFQHIGILLGVTALFTSCESDFEKTTMSMRGECKLMATATEADITIKNYQTPVLQLAWTTPEWYSNDNTRRTAGVGVTSLRTGIYQRLIRQLHRDSSQRTEHDFHRRQPELYCQEVGYGSWQEGYTLYAREMSGRRQHRCI